MKKLNQTEERCFLAKAIEKIRRLGKTAFFLGIILVLTSITINTVYSAPLENNNYKKRAGAFFERFSGKAKLTQEQKDKIKTIRDKYSVLINGIRTDLQNKRGEIITELQKDKPERAVVDQKLAEILQIQKQRQKLIVDEYFEIRELLTPEQNKVFLNRLAKSMARER